VVYWKQISAAQRTLSSWMVLDNLLCPLHPSDSSSGRSVASYGVNILWRATLPTELALFTFPTLSHANSNSSRKLIKASRCSLLISHKYAPFRTNMYWIWIHSKLASQLGNMGAGFCKNLKGTPHVSPEMDLCRSLS
jgi:hypothetical protein